MKPVSSVSSPPTAEKRRCQHCGNLFEPRFEEEHFCCSGCHLVFDLIQGSGYESFYELLGRRVLDPADRVDTLNESDLDLIKEAIAEEEHFRTSADAPAQLTLRVANLSCTACVWLIDHLFRQHNGALKISSDTSRSTLTLWWNPDSFDALAFVAELHRFGYPATLIDESQEELPRESRTLLTRLGVTAGLAMNAMAFSLPTYLGLDTSDDLARLFRLVTFASAALALAVGGSYFFQRAWQALKLRTLHMDVPISLGLISAFLGSLGGMIWQVEDMLYFDFVATFAFLMLLGRWIHLRLIERNRQQLWAKERQLMATFRLNSQNERERITPREVMRGDRLEIAAGAMLPVEATLVESQAALSLDWINGEPEPVTIRMGQMIPAGARNSSGEAVQVIANASFSGSSLESVIENHQVREETTESSNYTKVLRIYLTTVIFLSVLGAGCWIGAGRSIAEALNVFISVLVVSCPCALGLALPLLNEITLSSLRERGVFVRENALWHKLNKIRTISFDKTGTITEPVSRVINPEVISSLDETALSALRRLTANNHHPVGRAILDTLSSHYGALVGGDLGVVEEHPGKGVSFRSMAHEWRLGKAAWAWAGHQEGTCLSRDGEVIAEFFISESIREGAREQIEALRRKGFRLRLLSGDPRADRVEATAEALGIDSILAQSGLTPEEKADIIRRDGEGETLFIGDGGNDSLAFEAAAATGTPATGIRAIETRADFVFTGRGFHALSLIFQSAQRRRRLTSLIFLAAILYNLFAITLCLAGLMNPLLAAILMPLSSILTISIAAGARRAMPQPASRIRRLKDKEVKDSFDAGKILAQADPT